ncbi:small auxin-up RNA [Artemisia annua]|uniref:Small auxin-up RNA n=1 Tax=Artemisia annua TaxID=35608 RepID=A0A2U1M871_ARTAN|nr:small auxin-up RNA [Artemisia annua]
MESGKDKKNFLSKTWKRCRSFSHSHNTKGGVSGLPKSKSWNGKEMKKKKMAPEGFFPVYVGPEKQRFAIKTEYVNHPLFSMLLKDAESEYGTTHGNGPILLPCDVDLFYKVLAEMEAKDVQQLGWTFAYGSYSPFSPRRRLGTKGVYQMGKGFFSSPKSYLVTWCHFSSKSFVSPKVFIYGGCPVGMASVRCKVSHSFESIPPINALT